MAGVHQVRWMYHTTAMVTDYVRTRDWLVKFCGLRALEDEEITTPGIERRGGMVWIGDNSLELGQPLGTTAASARFVQRFGPGMHSVALQVADIDGTIAHLERLGVGVASRPLPFFIFADPRATEGLLFEFNGQDNHRDPRFGGQIPPYVRPPLLDVQHMAFGGAVVADPQAVATRLAEIFGTAVTFRRPDAGPGLPAAGVSLGDCTLALFQLPAPEAAIRLWGKPLGRAQVHVLGLTVPDLEAAERVLRGEGISILRRQDGLLVPDPTQTGDLPVAFMQGLLPGDPRLNQ